MNSLRRRYLSIEYVVLNKIDTVLGKLILKVRDKAFQVGMQIDVKTAMVNRLHNQWKDKII